LKATDHRPLSRKRGILSCLDCVGAYYFSLGQTLIVTSGLGWAQREGGPVEEIRPGDVVWFAPNEKHWHGAMPTTAMTHIAIQEALDGKVVE
jgi:quercetin dioxygenase-like cupin family protein